MTNFSGMEDDWLFRGYRVGLCEGAILKCADVERLKLFFIMSGWKNYKKFVLDCVSSI